MIGLSAKQALGYELARILEEQLEAAERMHRATLEAATHEEAKPENDKDTRALEQSYLARGQALRVEELRASLAAVQKMPARVFDEGAPVALGALVAIEEGERRFEVFIAPSGGGTTLEGGVATITPHSGLGRALVGRCAGDECTARLAGRTRDFTILRVV